MKETINMEGSDKYEQDNEEDKNSLGKFMVTPSQYEMYKKSGESLKDEEHGIKLMLEFFSEYFTEEQLKENMKQYNLEYMLEIVKKYFKKEYEYTVSNLELNNLYQESINSYIYDDMENPAVIHIDELLESTIVAFFLVVFKWSKDYEDLEVFKNCFRFLLYLMNDVCIFGKMQEEYANKVLLAMVANDIQILQLAESCSWTVLTFSIAHEVAHKYLASIGKKYQNKNRAKEEFDADAIAYHIVLKIIMDKEENNNLLQEYTYLAPMMYMDFFDLYFYTDRVLYKTRFFDKTHPTVKARKNQLFGIVDRPEYDFDTVDGNHLYGGFLDIYDVFKEELLLKMERGKLDSILRKEQREERRRKLNDKEAGD